MISFYPGPSRVHEQIPSYVVEAYDQGILSINHRSEAFMGICSQTISLLKSKLSIPEDYTVVFTSSATECWEIIAQSLVEKESHHFFNGAFGKKWFDYTKKLRPEAKKYEFDPEKELPIKQDLTSSSGVICITQNETANGTQVHMPLIADLKKTYPDHLIAVDATSSMAGIYLNFSEADIWFSSIQKCFGLPAGMGVMICSPRAIKKARELQENDHYNSLNFILKNIERFQTPYTPNVLYIYLLMRLMEDSPSIAAVEAKLKQRVREYEDTIVASDRFSLLINNELVRSTSVIVVEGNEDAILALKKKAEQAGLTLGNGYGPLKATTFRIANFPALKEEEVRLLQEFLKNNI